MAMLIELTDRDDGRGVLVNVDRATLINAFVGSVVGSVIHFGADEWVRVSGTLDEIAEKARALGCRVLMKEMT